MFSRGPMLLWCAGVLLLHVLASVPSQAETRYIVEDVGENVFVNGIDQYGVAYGYRLEGPDFDAHGGFFLPQFVPIDPLPGGTSATMLGRLPFYGSVGGSTTAESLGEMHAFYRVNGQMHDLGTLDGNPANFSIATGLNATTIVGYASDARFFQRPVLWDRHTLTITTLPTLGSYGVVGAAYAISTDGVIVGETAIGGHESDIHATMWVLGTPYDLTPGGNIDSSAFAINARHVVVGTRNGNAWRWHPTRGEKVFDKLPNTTFAELVSVNFAGIAVGRAGVNGEENDAHAILCDSLTCTDLNTLHAQPNWVLHNATGINDQGVIVGEASWKGQRRGYRLSPLR